MAVAATAVVVVAAVMAAVAAVTVAVVAATAVVAAVTAMVAVVAAARGHPRHLIIPPSSLSRRLRARARQRRWCPSLRSPSPPKTMTS